MAKLVPNPALLLHERLSAWKVTPGGKTVLGVREQEGRPWHEVHLETLGWVLAVRDHMRAVAELRGDDDTEDVSILTDRLLTGIFVIDSSMTSPISAARHHFSDSDLLPLKHIGRQWQLAAANVEGQADLLDVAQEVQRLVIDSTHLDDEARQYLHQVASHLVKAVGDIEISGATNVRSLANELAGALFVYFADAPGDEMGEAKTFAQRLLKSVHNIFKRHVVPAALEASANAAIAAIAPPS